jgi:hypothetical protein
MTDKEIIERFKIQFITERPFTESQALILMDYARGDVRETIKDLLPTEEDVEFELIDEEESGNQHYRKGYRAGAGKVLKLIGNLL